ncbi:hypothetical protein K492DRAFT_200548 [Lichtheimia hyalospora FSU 10163]|nr:hypothetical protein K492DRAFT_200548 [Lichtheimia hyalospora FSU 10163]
MGIKGLHQFLRTSNILQQGVDVPQQLLANNVDIIFVDFCCEFMSMLQLVASSLLLRLKLQGGNADDNLNIYGASIDRFINSMFMSLQQLLDLLPGTTICLVVDGEPLFAKKETHRARELHRRNALKLAKKRYLANPNVDDAQLRKYSKKWVSFTAAIKEYIIQQLVEHGCQEFNNDVPNQGGIVYLSAPFEADPVVVHLANQRPYNSAIISRDGDLFAYYGAVDVPRILKFNWEIGGHFGQGNMTTKRELLNALAGHHIEGFHALQMAQAEFAVHAAASGNDYAQNIPQISFATIHRSLQSLRPFHGNTNEILQRLVETLGNRANTYFIQRFQIALFQYARPIVGDDDLRSEAMPFQVIPHLMQYTGAELFFGGTGPQPQGSRYTFLPGDGQYFQEQFIHTARENIDPLRPRPPRRFTSRQKQIKRTFGAARSTQFPDNRTFKHPDADSIRPYSYKSRSMVTCHAGLYSSVLAVGDRNATQAIIITNVIRTLVNKMSFARFSCLHIADIAMREAYITLNNQQRYAFYDYFFGDKTQRDKTWRFILYCAMDYQPAGRSGVTNEERNAAINAAVQDRVDDIVNQQGNIHNGDHHLFKAYPDDVAYIYLFRYYMEGEHIVRNIILKARKIWYSGEFGMLHELVPSSLYMDAMVTEIAHGLDLAFHQNVVINFRTRYCDYLRRRLQETAGFPHGWNNDPDFVNTVIQCVHAQNRLQAANTILHAQHIPQGIKQDVVDFVHRMHNKYHLNLLGFDNNVCLQELINEATVPEQWPENQDRLVRYIFQQIWGIPLYSGEENRDADEQTENQQAQQEIQQLPQAIQNAINEFINNERDIQVVDIPVNQYDLRQCLGLDPPGEPQVIEQPTDLTVGIVRPGNGNGNGNPDDNTNYVDNADDEEFDEEDLEDEYYGRPRKAAATRLVPLMVYMLQHCNGYLIFPLTPKQPWGPIAIPFNHGFTDTMKKQFEHFSLPQVSEFHQYIVEAIHSGDEQKADQLEQALDNMLAVINQVKGLPSTSNRFIQFFDITRCATIVNGERQVTDRGYLRWLNTNIPGTNTKRFSLRRIFLTNGIRVYSIYVDWLRHKRETVQGKYLTELRRTTREAMIPLISSEDETMGQAVDLSTHFRGVIGMDFGEVCPVASVYRPTNSLLHGSQLVIKRGFLYGRTFLNRNKYNNMKAMNGIDQLLTELGTSTTKGTYEQLMQYYNTIKGNQRAYRLWMFQSKASVMRLKWDNFMSTRSRIDQACFLIMNQANATAEQDHTSQEGYDPQEDTRPLVFGFGLDGISQRNRRGAVAAMDQKLINALFRKIKQVNRSKVVHLRDFCTRVDEYMTSQTCCRCIKDTIVAQAEYLVRQANLFDRMEQNAQGQVEVYRIVVCEHNNVHIYHRDGNAAENMATIMRYMLRFQQRPARFIRPSRLPAAQQ